MKPLGDLLDLTGDGMLRRTEIGAKEPHDEEKGNEVFYERGGLLLHYLSVDWFSSKRAAVCP